MMPLWQGNLDLLDTQTLAVNSSFGDAEPRQGGWKLNAMVGAFQGPTRARAKCFMASCAYNLLSHSKHWSETSISLLKKLLLPMII